MEDLITKEKIEVEIPKNYNVILLNDDYTAIEFVIYVLMTIFKKSKEEAFSLAKSIHNSGKGIAGTYTREIAETKTIQCETLAKENGYPLKADIESA